MSFDPTSKCWLEAHVLYCNPENAIFDVALLHLKKADLSGSSSLEISYPREGMYHHMSLEKNYVVN